MKAIMTVQNLASDLVTTIWTPIFFALFIAIVDLCGLASQQGRLR